MRMPVQVLFCVMLGETTYVVNRKLIYMGPPASSQLEGRLALPAAPHKELLVGTQPLQWRDAARLLEAPREVANAGGHGGEVGDEGDNVRGGGEAAPSDDVPASA